MSNDGVCTYLHEPDVQYMPLADVKIETVSMSGHERFTAWEWNLTFHYAKGSEREAEGGGEVVEEVRADDADGRVWSYLVECARGENCEES